MKTLNLGNLSVEWLGHDCFKVKNKRIIYFDPFELKGKLEQADLILITHEHFDHCSTGDLKKIIKKETIVIAADICRKTDIPILEGGVKKIVYIKPKSTFTIDEIKIETVPAYNTNKFRSPGVPFHPKGENRVGYILNLDGKRIYHAGDTDLIPEMGSLKDIDLALLPVSGTYVMTSEEAVEAVKTIKPKFALPMHYGEVVGSREDAEKFKRMAESFTQVAILE